MKSGTKYIAITIIIFIAIIMFPVVELQVSTASNVLYYPGIIDLLGGKNNNMFDNLLGIKATSLLNTVLFLDFLGACSMLYSHISWKKRRTKYFVGALVIFLSNILLVLFLPQALSIKTSEFGIIVGETIKTSFGSIFLRLGLGWWITTILAGYIVFFYGVKKDTIYTFIAAAIVIIAMYGSYTGAFSDVQTFTPVETFAPLPSMASTIEVDTFYSYYFVVTDTFNYANTVSVVSGEIPSARGIFINNETTLVVNDSFYVISSANQVTVNVPDYNIDWDIIGFYLWFNSSYLSSLRDKYEREIDIPLPGGNYYDYERFSRQVGRVFRYDYVRSETASGFETLIANSETMKCPDIAMLPHEMISRRSGICEDFATFWGALELAYGRKVTIVIIEPINEEYSGHQFIVDQYGYVIENDGYFYNNFDEAMQYWRSYYGESLVAYLLEADPTYGITRIETMQY